MTPIADMVERMLADGVASAAVVLAVRTAETVTLRERDASRLVTIPSRSLEAERAARYREKIKQNKVNAEANDAAHTDNPERDASRLSVTECTNLLPSSLLTKGSAEKVSKRENARATRMAPDSPLTELYRAAAIKLGASPERVPEMWVEHVDYWVAVPGARGLKTDWPATWRNDVRRKLKLGTYNGRTQADKSVVAGADRILERMRSFDEPLRSRNSG